MADVGHEKARISYMSTGRSHAGSPPESGYGSRMKKNTPTSDPIYKRLYAFVEMVADLLRSVVPKATLEALDLRTLEKVSADYVGEHFQQRHGDTVWRVRAGGPDSAWAYVLVLLEFQSSNDATMALRVNEYTVMLYRELLRAKKVEPGQLPLVLPVVLYNGDSRWTAADNVRDLIVSTGPTDTVLDAFQPSQRYLPLDLRHAKADYAGELTTGVARLEQIRTPDDLDEVVEHFAAALSGVEHEELWRTIRDWLFAVIKRMEGVDDPGPPPPDLTLEDLRTMTLEERVAQWPEQWKREGIELGIVQGRREQLRSLAEVQFGAPTAERLFASLQREDDPQRLDAIGKAVVRCETADELLRQASHPTPDA